MKRKVLHVINSMQPGGAEILLVNSLSAGGLCEHVENHLAYFMAPSYLLDKLDKNVKVHFLTYKGGMDIFRLIKSLRRVIIDNNIDIVHSHLNPASFYTELACPKKIPHVHTLHIAYTTDFETRPILKLLERKLFFDKKNSNIIFLSAFTQADFLGAVQFKGTSFVLNNFIDDVFYLHPFKQKNSAEKKQLKVLAVGYLRPQKNYFYLLEIFQHLSAYNIQLDIYGGGNQEEYNKIISKNKLNITLKGPVANINGVITQYDLFIMASANEGFPLSVFEAMAAGVPLMLSNIKPLTSIVNENAIYFDLNDAEKAARQLISILDGEIDITAMAANAKTYAEKTTRREIYMEKLLSIYDTVIAAQ